MKYLSLLVFCTFFIGQPKPYEIKMVSVGNFERNDFCPKKYENGLFFSSIIKGENSPSFSEIYYAENINEEVLGKIQQIEVLDRNFGNCGATEFKPINQELIFSMTNKMSGLKVKYKKNGKIDKKRSIKIKNTGLYWGVMKNYEVRESQLLHFCDINFNFSHPTLSEDGLTLIFSSDVLGNGMKLFETKRSSIDEDWGDYRFLEEIKGDQLIFPNLLNDTLLTYSRQLEPGNLDIFVATKLNGKWNNIRNWIELNSPQDDHGVEMIDSVSGYFSSNRTFSGDKLYYFNMNPD